MLNGTAYTNSGATSFLFTGPDSAQSVVDYCFVLPLIADFHPLLIISEYDLLLKDHYPLVASLHILPLPPVPLSGGPPPKSLLGRSWMHIWLGHSAYHYSWWLLKSPLHWPLLYWVRSMQHLRPYFCISAGNRVWPIHHRHTNLTRNPRLSYYGLTWNAGRLSVPCG